MLNFCTLFDSFYLFRGLAMYESLKKNCADFQLYIFAFDDLCYNTLLDLHLTNVTLISLQEFEDEQLLSVKPTRSKAEYCWTCTSSTILYCLKTYNLDSCTYLDSDLYFYGPPQILLDEVGDNSILITEHRYSKPYDQSKVSGKYCVQFVYFRNDERGLIALNWWRDRCIEWCFAYIEDGKFGDQKYLDDWTERFEGVHVMKNFGGGCAPWNVQQFDIFIENNQHKLREYSTGRVSNLVFYHFHLISFLKDKYDLGNYRLSASVKHNLYVPYIQHIETVKKKMIVIDEKFVCIGLKSCKFNWSTFIVFIERVVKPQFQFNIYKINYFKK